MTLGELAFGIACFCCGISLSALAYVISVHRDLKRSIEKTGKLSRLRWYYP